MEYTHPALRTLAQVWLAQDATGPGLTASHVEASMQRPSPANPAERPNSSKTGSVQLLPGDTGPGESATILLAMAAWVRCSQPADALHAATTVCIEGSCGDLWVQHRGTALSTPHPAAT